MPKFKLFQTYPDKQTEVINDVTKHFPDSLTKGFVMLKNTQEDIDKMKNIMAKGIVFLPMSIY